MVNNFMQGPVAMLEPEVVREMDSFELYEKYTRRAYRFYSHPGRKIRSIRKNMGLSQSEFSRLIGVSNRTLENWEQERRTPTGPAVALLHIVNYEPDLALRALRGFVGRI